MISLTRAAPFEEGCLQFEVQAGDILCIVYLDQAICLLSKYKSSCRFSV